MSPFPLLFFCHKYQDVEQGTSANAAAPQCTNAWGLHSLQKNRARHLKISSLLCVRASDGQVKPQSLLLPPDNSQAIWVVCYMDAMWMSPPLLGADRCLIFGLKFDVIRVTVPERSMVTTAGDTAGYKLLHMCFMFAVNFVFNSTPSYCYTVKDCIFKTVRGKFTFKHRFPF